jgi:hypothetical protein
MSSTNAKLSSHENTKASNEPFHNIHSFSEARAEIRISNKRFILSCGRLSNFSCYFRIFSAMHEADQRTEELGLLRHPAVFAAMTGPVADKLPEPLIHQAA